MLAGCSVNYEVVIKNDKITEKIKIIETDSNYITKTFDSGLNMKQIFSSIVKGDEFTNKDYNASVIDKDNEVGLNYSKTFTNFNSSDVIGQCYDSYLVEKNDKIVSIDTGDEFTCYEYYENINEINVVFKTNNKVITNNADEVNGNKYTWHITESGNKRINFVYEIKKDNSIYFIVIGLLVVVGIIIISIYNKIKKTNSI